MAFCKKRFIDELCRGGVRSSLPIMTSPGMELLDASPRQVFKDGFLQYKCIKALAEKFPASARVTFMDLSVEAEAFGAPVQYSDHENPTVSAPIAGTPEAVEALVVPAAGVRRTAEAVKCAGCCAKNIQEPVFAGTIGPYTLAGRLADMTEIMIMLYTAPDTAGKLISKSADFITAYIAELKKTGVAGVMIAEPAAGLISPEMCDEFSSHYIRRICDAVKDDDFMVILHNCGQTEDKVETMLASGADALHVGNAVDIIKILQQTPADIPVMGNLDPVGVFRNMDPAGVYQATADLLNRTAEFPNFVLSSGCDMPVGVPLDNITAYLNALNDYNNKIVQGLKNDRL